jgi:hypothetical protein
MSMGRSLTSVPLEMEFRKGSAVGESWLMRKAMRLLTLKTSQWPHVKAFPFMDSMNDTGRTLPLFAP